MHHDEHSFPIYVLSPVLDRFPYFFCINMSQKNQEGQTELASNPSVLVKGQRVHNAGMAEYQGL